MAIGKMIDIMKNVNTIAKLLDAKDNKGDDDFIEASVWNNFMKETLQSEKTTSVSRSITVIEAVELIKANILNMVIKAGDWSTEFVQGVTEKWVGKVRSDVYIDQDRNIPEPLDQKYIKCYPEKAGTEEFDPETGYKISYDQNGYIYQIFDVGGACIFDTCGDGRGWWTGTELITKSSGMDGLSAPIVHYNQDGSVRCYWRYSSDSVTYDNDTDIYFDGSGKRITEEEYDLLDY